MSPVRSRRPRRRLPLLHDRGKVNTTYPASAAPGPLVLGTALAGLVPTDAGVAVAVAVLARVALLAAAASVPPPTVGTRTDWG